MTNERLPPPGSAVLVLGFGATVVTWAIAWFSQLSPGALPPLALAAAVAAILLGAGAAGARRYGLRARGGAGVGLVSATANLLVLGSLIGETGNVAWVPGSLVVAAALGALGAAIVPRRLSPPRADARLDLSLVALGAAFLLVILGGVVTTKGAGLAVPDYPNTYGYNMFLYPFSKMHGGIYFEHTHRLLGALLGLTTIVLAVFLQRTEPRPWVRRFGWAILAAVVVQGLMGGLRVDALLSGRTEPTETRPVIAFAVAHGVFGQICFALFAVLAAVLAPVWRRAGEPRPGGSADRVLTRVLVAAVIVQLALGAAYRHLGELLAVHLLGAMVVLGLAVATSARLGSLYGEVPALRRCGRALGLLVFVQIALGILALLARNAAPEPADRAAHQVAILTAHQTLGATILAVSAASMFFTSRLLSREPARPPSSPADLGKEYASPV